MEDRLDHRSSRMRIGGRGTFPSATTVTAITCPKTARQNASILSETMSLSFPPQRDYSLSSHELSLYPSEAPRQLFDITFFHTKMKKPANYTFQNPYRPATQPPPYSRPPQNVRNRHHEHPLHAPSPRLDTRHGSPSLHGTNVRLHTLSPLKISPPPPRYKPMPQHPHRTKAARNDPNNRERYCRSEI